MSALLASSWAIEALIASSLLMAFVLVVRKPAQRAFGPQLAYWFWALPALRMAMPPLPAAWREQAAAPLTAASETVILLVAPIVPAAAPDAGAVSWLAIVAGVWALGALGFFFWHGLVHVSYVREILAPPARHERLPDGTTLVESDAATGPVAFGVLRRFVAVPTDFEERYDADERRLALAHELGHHARGDLIANWIALAMLAVHWFNPLAWFAYRKFRSDQEMANDARVLSALRPIERHAYACAIVKAAHGRAVTAACHLHTIEDLKGRLRMLRSSRKSRRVLMAGAAGIAGLTLAGLGLTASGAAAEKIRTVTETRVAALTQAALAQPIATPPAPTLPKAPPAPKTNPVKKVIVFRDGKTETLEGAQADAFLASDRAVPPTVPGERRHRIVITDKGGTTRTYEGAEADAYLKLHPELRPPVPPVPPAPPLPGHAATAPAAPRVTLFGSERKPFAGAGLDVRSGDCGPGDAREFVRHERANGRPRMIICEERVRRFAESQARAGASISRVAMLEAGADKRIALASLAGSRAAIERAAGLTDAQRTQALAGLDAARVELEREAEPTRAN